MKKILHFALLGLLAIGCASDDDSSEMQEPVMEVEKDGVSFTVTTFNNTLVEEVQDNQRGRRLDLRANVDGGTLILAVSNWDWQNPPDNGLLEKTYDTNTEDEGPNGDCMTEGNITFCDGALGSYLAGNVNYVSEGIEDEMEGEIVITQNNAEEQVVSGTFDLVVQDIFTEEKIRFTGRFDQLLYTVF